MTDITETARELRVRLSRATQGEWQLQDGCSWRRIGTHMHDGNVLCPSTYSREDRHPDLIAGKGEDLYENLELIVAMKNALPALLDHLTAYEREVEQMRAALEPFAKAAEKRQVGADDAERVTWSDITVGDLRRARTALATLDAAVPAEVAKLTTGNRP